MVRYPVWNSSASVPMASTSNADSSSVLPSIPSSDTEVTWRWNSISTRNAGVPVSNQWESNVRLRNSSRMSKANREDHGPPCNSLGAGHHPVRFRVAHWRMCEANDGIGMT